MPKRSSSVVAVLFTAAIVFVLSGPAAQADPGAHKVALRTLSTRPDTVSGGDVLVQVTVPANVRLTDVRVTLNGRDVTAAFRPGQVPGSLVGLVEGLALGENTLKAKAKGATDAKLKLVNHPITGPIFSGPHQTPFICETATFTLPVTGGTLGLPLDANCSAATRVDYVYRSTAATFQPLPNPTVRPADLAQTTTAHGRTVPYIVRVETGTINRAIYQTAILHDPATEPAPHPWTRPAGWNGRLIYAFGGGCRAGYHQAQLTVNVLNDAWLSRGYAAAASSLNIFESSCNDVISAETTMMVKERFIERFGAPRYTIGSGGSGGSMQQHLITQNYPGLLDGIQPSSSFADSWTFEIPLADCALLDHAFNTSTQPWTFDQKTAVAGWGTWQHCINNISWNRVIDPNLLSSPEGVIPVVRGSCAAVIPPALIYDPVTNPDGARCTWQDNLVNVFGLDPKTGFARRPLDNVGVQYGLVAFNAGQISAEQFLDVNARVGGYDIDANIVPTRMVADRKALRIAYRTGRLDSGSGGLGAVPMIDFRTYRDHLGDVHDAVRSHITRARLIATNGHADNQVILVSSLVGTGAGSSAAVAAEALRLMDQWLDNIASDTSEASAADKVVRNKPPELVDACYTATGQKITDEATCRQLYPLHGNPRLAAGEPLAQDVLKCKLTPVDPRDYVQPLTANQLQRLEAIFPEGVCDYSRRGAGQHGVKGTWLSYSRHGDGDDQHEDDDHDDAK